MADLRVRLRCWWRGWQDRGFIARGGPASRKPTGGYPAALTLPEMILATILRARFRMPLRVAAELSGVVIGTIAKAERQIRPLLDQRLARHPAGRNARQDPRRTMGGWPGAGRVSRRGGRCGR